MLFYSDGDPSDACFDIGVEGFCIMIGMKSLQPQQLGTSVA